MPEHYIDVIYNFIEDIPDSKLEGGIGSDYVHKDINLRLDNQGTFTRDGVEYYNLQVQVNKGCKHRTLKKLAPDTVAICLAPIEEPWTGEQIRKALAATVTGRPLDRPGA